MRGIMLPAVSRPPGIPMDLRVVVRLIAGAMLLLWMSPPAQAQSGSRVFLIEVSGGIGVATTRQLSRAIERAQAEQASVLIVQLDTPGGLVSSTRELIKQIISSAVPVVVYVAPSGARAASAGTFLVYAAHLAAM